MSDFTIVLTYEEMRQVELALAARVEHLQKGPQPPRYLPVTLSALRKIATATDTPEVHAWMSHGTSENGK